MFVTSGSRLRLGSPLASIVITMFTFARLWTEAPTFWSGLLAIVDEATNYKLYLTIALFSSPALAAMWWREKRRTRANRAL
jgi:hypothetical protein